MLQRFKKRLLAERAKPFAPTGTAMDPLPLGELRGELEQLTTSVLHKAGIDPQCVTVKIEQFGTTPDKRPVMRTMMELVRWEPASALRLLVGLAHIERGMRRAVASSWVAESCHFAGVWLHTGEAALEPTSLRHLASVLGSHDQGFTSSESSAWSASTGPDNAYAATVPSQLAKP